MYKFWLTKAERERLDKARQAAEVAERVDRLPKALEELFFWYEKGDGGDTTLWHKWRNNEPVTKEQLEAFLARVPDKRKLRFMGELDNRLYR